MGGGQFNSKWMATIDNTGETVVLHNRDHIRLVQKPYSQEMIKQLEGDGTIHLHKHKDVVSNVHIFTGYKYSDHSILQVGDFCPDEILELALDEKLPSIDNLGT